MNLQEAIIKYGGRNVKIGASEGISFIYCDILPDVPIAEKIKLFEDLDKQYYKKLKETQKNSIADLKGLEASIGNRKRLQAKEIYEDIIKGAIESKYFGGDPVDIDSLMEEIDKAAIEYRRTRVNNLIKKINKQHYQIKDWTPLLQREIVEVRKSIKIDETIEETDIENRIALIIEYKGEERGPYWDRYEYINGLGSNEEDEEDE